MALLETLALAVGPAVAKNILKFWLGDYELAQNIGGDIIDLLKSKVPDILAQQRGKREFEAIGEKVAENLQPLFEDTPLTEEQRDAVARAVSETLNQVKITPEILVQRDLEPEQLAKYLLDSRPAATQDFSEAETELYVRIIKESAYNIVDISSQLPNFTERTFSKS